MKKSLFALCSLFALVLTLSQAHARGFEGHRDPCNRFSAHGISACLNRTECDWSSNSRSCFSRQGMHCHAYTQHGISACMNAAGCDWSSDSRSCYVKQGERCSYYTRHGISACLNARGCDWSSQSRSCYRR